jgi:hypothetical protein
MSTRAYVMPKTPVIDREGKVTLGSGYQGYLGGLEDVSKRVSAYVDPSTATVSTLIAALIAAGLMKAE